MKYDNAIKLINTIVDTSSNKTELKVALIGLIKTIYADSTPPTGRERRGGSNQGSR